MGKVTRKPQEKHKVSLSPAVSEFVKKISAAPFAELPALFSGWSQRWPYPRGDLNNWIEPLDRFDSILQTFNAKYGLDKGPQTTAFGLSLLLEGSPGFDEKRLKELGFGPEGDRELVEAILVFSKLLVEKCANRAVYNSTDRLNDLLNTTSLSLLHSTLRITFYLAQRYAERAPPVHHMTVKFYDFDHERLQSLAAPLGQPPSPAKRGTTSPLKTTKSKEKFSQSGKTRRGSTAANPNDFRSLCRDPASQSDRGKPAAVPDRDWHSWANVRVSWSQPKSTEKHVAAEEVPSSDIPSSPTPIRQPSSGLSRLDTGTSSGGNASRRGSTQGEGEVEVKTIELSPTDLAGTTIDTILRNHADDMPPRARYELLHQLRVAYGLITSNKTRKELLAIRLLSIASLARVFSEPELSEKLFPPTTEPGGQKHHDLIQQIVGLIIQDTKKGQSSVSLYLQTIAMETMGTLARFKTFSSEVNAALGAGSSQGLLSHLILKGLNDIAQDNDSTDTHVGDDWREAIFSMPRTLIDATGHHGRSSEPVIASSFLTTYLSGFNITTGKALRVHLYMLDFIKTFFHHFKDGLATLLASNAFEAISNLHANLVNSAWAMYQAGDGMPRDYKTRATDYEIPYVHQQIIRSVIDMINDISSHQGTQADRVLRSLVDSQALLHSFRLIADHLEAFGAHTWSEVVKAVCGFLHNEPTSYTVISEAGIVQSFIATITGSPASSDSKRSKTISSEPQNRPQGIPPVVDAIAIASQIFGAICLTTAGSDFFMSSGALEKFFEIFESPDHVKALSDGNTLALLGSTFDELVRHHPNLRNSILSAVIVMIARVRHIARWFAVNHGAGAKLWLEVENELVPSGGCEALSWEVVPPTTTDTGGSASPRTIKLPDGDTLSFVDDVLPPSRFSGTPSDKDSNGLRANDYTKPALAFLVAFFENQSLCTSFLDHGGCDLVLDFITLPSLPAESKPFDSHDSTLQDLASVVHMMAETKPHIVVPPLADRARFACSELKHFSQNQPKGWTSYFAPLIKPKTEPQATVESSGHSASDVELTGTRLVRAMRTVFGFAQVMAEVLNVPMYSTRTLPTSLCSVVNLTDIFTDICIQMGSISAACYRENIAIQRSVPEAWLSETRPDHFSTGDDEVDQIFGAHDSTDRLIDGMTPDQAQDQTDNNEARGTESSWLSNVKQTASFKNVQTLRYLLIETPSSITEFLGRLGHGITGRRRPADLFSRRKIACVANALASACLTQLQPSFLSLEAAEESSGDMEPRFTYLVIALDNVRRSFPDESSSSGPGAGNRRPSQSFVIEAFREAGGLKALTLIGIEFFDKLKSCKVDQSMFSANAGLKVCLDILDSFTDSRSIIGSTQSNIMKNSEPTKGVWFVPPQVLLSLRIDALPLTRLIWESDYVDQASKDVVQKLVSILNHILTGDEENSEAVQKNDTFPVLAPAPTKKMDFDPQKISVLKEKGYKEDLVREAIYRTNAQSAPSLASAEEYCEAFTTNPRRRRLPIPETDVHSSVSAHGTPNVMSPPDNPQSLPTTATLSSPSATGIIEAALAEVVNNASDDSAMEDVVGSNTPQSTPMRQAGSGVPNGSSAMDISNILNDDDESRRRLPEPLQPESSPIYSVETITEQRAAIREDLAERCNNVLSNHPNLTFELSDLIISATKRLSRYPAKDYWRTTTSLLISSLLSMQVEEDMSEAQGRKIGAAAHLNALLIQDREVFKETLSVYQEAFEGLLSYLRLPAKIGSTSETPFQWVAAILLIIEQMLSRDSEPADVTWDPPTDVDTIGKAKITPVSFLHNQEKLQLFEALVNMLPRVGKDRTMALAISRVLVILTRTRAIATLLAEKKNLQRLFLMVKQLGTVVGHRLQSSFMIVLRHIVEDDETIKQIMRSEIEALFTGRSSSRQVDTTSYVRELSHLVLRSPQLFVEVTKEMVKLSSWSPHGSNAVGFVLKDARTADVKDDGAIHAPAQDNDVSMQPAPSVETAQDTLENPDKGKAPETKAPVVEHPDGVIHFILSELLNYKDVEDKEPVSQKTAPAEPSASGDETRPTTFPDPSDDAGPVPQAHPRPERTKFKPEDHPIFSYRGFLMYNLTELLHSYNRTKIEFINFSRKADPMAVTPSKPRSGVLNYLLNGLIPSCYVDKEDSLHFKKKLLTSDWAIRVVVALCSKTGESGSTSAAQRFSFQPQVDDMNNEPDLTFVRRFVLEHAIKSYKDAISSTEPLQMKYSRLLCLADTFNRLLTKPAVPEGAAGSQNNSYKVLARMMFEKNFITVLTSSLADIDLSYPGSKRVIKFILRPLQELTTLATHLSITDPDFMNSVAGNMSDDVISSASSVSDVEEDREETPDLFRNSALGLLDPNRDPESESASDAEDEDEEMYDEEYDDEIEYDEGMGAGPNDDEAVSDDEVDDGMGPEGEIEGLPGDMPMDIEFVVNDPHMEVDTDEDEDDDEDDDSDDEDEDDEEDDGEDFMVEDDDDPGEINADDENNSLHGGQEEEGEWEDEEGDEDEDSDEHDEVAEITFDGDEGPLDRHLDENTPGVLSNLLRVLNEHGPEGFVRNTHIGDPELGVHVAGTGAQGDEEDDEEDDDDDEEGDEMDENDEMGPEFDRFFTGEFRDFGELQGTFLSGDPGGPRLRHFRIPGGMALPEMIERRLAHHRGVNFQVRRQGRLSQHHNRSAADEGLNPLLRRPQQDLPRPYGGDGTGPGMFLPHDLDLVPSIGMFPPLGATFHTTIRNGDTMETASHGAVLDNLLQNLHRGERGDTRFQISTSAAPVSEIRELMRPTMSGVGHRHHSREESSRPGNFIPALTMTRWQEEARLLFGNMFLDRAQRVQLLIMSLLVPLAQKEEKERRRKREEEQKAEREEMERLRVESERRKKEAEEREAAAKAEEASLRAEADAAAAAAAGSPDEDRAEQDDGDTEPMEDVQGTDEEAAHGSVDNASDGATTESQPRIYTSIRGRQIDITGLSIDADYLEALPEDLREEVIMQQYAARREEARQEGTESTGIDPDFLNALPEDIREEIRHQEALMQRRRDREAARRQAADAGGPAQPEEMDNDTFFATLDPAFRRVILAEQPPEILRQLDPRHAAEVRTHSRRLVGDLSRSHHRDGLEERAHEDGPQRDNKRQILQMVDKSGVATVLRLMFLPQQGSLRTNLWHILRNICANRQTRLEVVNLLLQILKEGSTDVSAVERSLANLSLRAKVPVGQKTPQPLKRTLSLQPAGSISEDVTPLVVVQQCLSALKQLSQHSFHTRTIFLREIDINPASKKGKGKAKDVKTVKYPINDLISLLDRKLIIESSTCLQSLAELLSAVTQPLPMLLRKDKEKPPGEEEPTDDGLGEQAATSPSHGGSGQSGGEQHDLELRDAPTAGAENDAPEAAAHDSSEQNEPREAGAAANPDTNSTDDLTGAESKSRKPFEPPEISEHNLQLVVSIFVAPECSSDTFHSTLEALSSLSCIPGIAIIFSKELINHIKILSQNICTDLDELTPQLRESQSITELHAVSSSRFSHSGSDQVKLLRVLQALDYLSAPKTESDDSEENAVAKSVLTSSYDGLGLRPLWDKLGECLTIIREKDNITGFATILLPLIESLMVVCKNTSIKDSILARQVREQLSGSPAPEAMNDVQELFFNFTTEHRKILNDIIRQSPKLMQGNGSFSLLVKNPKVLDFDNKRAYFTKQIHSRLHQQRHIQPPLQLNVRRDQVFLDSYKALYYKSADEMKYGKLNIRFNGEEGVDAGGVTREWFQVLARGMFNPDWALWQPVAADRTTFHPNPLSWINGEHLLYFKFIGRIIGKALHEGRVLDCHFSRAVYKRLLGKEPNLKDLESMDLDYYKSLCWILENDITDVITEDFSVIEEQFGEEKVVDLIPGGRNIPVTEENKREYVNAQVRYRLTTSVSEQLEHFVRGFHDIIPAELVAIFDEQELELLISGLPEIDVDDWKAHTEYHNYTANSPQIIWFWRIVRGMSNEERAKLLQFVTGTSKVPLNGFKDLEGMQGNTLFSIHKDPSPSRLPTSHTCFNQLDLPSYDDYDTLKGNLMTAINLGADYFGFA